MDYDPKNVISVLAHINATFGLDALQAYQLRQRVEKTFRAQPQVFSKRAAAPVTLNGVAITYGLLIGFGGLRAALRVSGDRVVKLARGFDPFSDLDKEEQKRMHRRATMNRGVWR